MAFMIDHVEPLSPTRVRVVFTEPLVLTAAVYDRANYAIFVRYGYGSVPRPILITPAEGENPSQVDIDLLDGMQAGGAYGLRVRGLVSLVGNEIEDGYYGQPPSHPFAAEDLAVQAGSAIAAVFGTAFLFPAYYAFPMEIATASGMSAPTTVGAKSPLIEPLTVLSIPPGAVRDVSEPVAYPTKTATSVANAGVSGSDAGRGTKARSTSFAVSGGSDVLGITQSNGIRSPIIQSPVRDSITYVTAIPASIPVTLYWPHDMSNLNVYPLEYSLNGGVSYTALNPQGGIPIGIIAFYPFITFNAANPSLFSGPSLMVRFRVDSLVVVNAYPAPHSYMLISEEPTNILPDSTASGSNIVVTGRGVVGSTIQVWFPDPYNGSDIGGLVVVPSAGAVNGHNAWSVWINNPWAEPSYAIVDYAVRQTTPGAAVSGWVNVSIDLYY
jgi:hypothetical protein